MGGRTVPRRTVATARILQASCAGLSAASLVAIGQGTPVVAVHDGAVTARGVYEAIPTDWERPGPLAIPTIGVVPPGLEDWYDPRAPRSTATRHDLPPALSVARTRAPVRSHEQLSPALGSAPPTTSPDTAIPTPTQAPATTTPPGTTAPATTAPETTTPPETTAPETTAPETTAPETTAPETTTPQTTTPPVTTAPPTPTETPPPTEEPPAPVETSERGHVVLGLGEQLTVLEGGALVLGVAVDSVVADVTCTGPGALPAVNGHLIAVQVRLTTGSDLTSLGAEPTVRATDFSFVGADGVALTEAGTDSAASCVPDTAALPAGPLAPGQELAGTVVLDAPATTGTLVLAPEFLVTGAEWAY